MGVDSLEIQAFICPYCFDDHTNLDNCKREYLRKTIDDLKEEKKKLLDALDGLLNVTDDSPENFKNNPDIEEAWSQAIHIFCELKGQMRFKELNEGT